MYRRLDLEGECAWAVHSDGEGVLVYIGRQGVYIWGSFVMVERRRMNNSFTYSN